MQITPSPTNPNVTFIPPKRSWYRAPSLSYTTPEDIIDRQARDYLAWLAINRGWLTDEVPCNHCHGTGETQSWSGGRNREYSCTYCNGGGFNYKPNSPDMTKAQAHVSTQRDWLASLAESACEKIRERLSAYGFAPVSRSWGGTDRTRYVAPGIDGDIHVDTTGWHRYYGRVKPTYSIIISAGRAPSDYELDMIVEEAVEALIGLPRLALAA